MGQKIHPLGFRLGITQKHRSSWFENKYMYPTLLEEDYKLRSYINKTVPNAGISKIEIHRKSNQVEVCIYASRPGILVGQSGKGVNTLKAGLRKYLAQDISLRVNINEIKSPNSDATLVGEFIAQQLKKRVQFRRATRQAIQNAQKVNIQGIKVQVSGRMNGAEIARSEWVRDGRVPLQTLRADIDYAIIRAHTTHGVLGIKVWIFNKELEPKLKSLVTVQ